MFIAIDNSLVSLPPAFLSLFPFLRPDFTIGKCYWVTFYHSKFNVAQPMALKKASTNSACVGARESTLLYLRSHTALHTKPPHDKRILDVRKRQGHLQWMILPYFRPYFTIENGYWVAFHHSKISGLRRGIRIVILIW